MKAWTHRPGGDVALVVSPEWAKCVSDLDHTTNGHGLIEIAAMLSTRKVGCVELRGVVHVLTGSCTGDCSVHASDVDSNPSL